MSDHYVPYCGRLPEAQEHQFADHLDEYLYVAIKQIIAYVEELFGVTYSISEMRDLLHRIGFTYKQTKAVASHAEAQRAFVEEALPELLAQVETGRAEVYFADGTHPTYNTKTGRNWIRKGQDFEINRNNGRKRVNINGAIRAHKPEHLVYGIAEIQLTFKNKIPSLTIFVVDTKPMSEKD